MTAQFHSPRKFRSPEKTIVFKQICTALPLKVQQELMKVILIAMNDYWGRRWDLCCIHRRSDVSQMLSGQCVDLSSLLRRSEEV